MKFEFILLFFLIFRGGVVADPTWTRLSQPYGGTINYFIFSPVEEKVVFAGTSDNYSALPVYMSSNAGVSWRGLDVEGILRMQPGSSNQLIVCGFGVYQSNDLGNSWQRISDFNCNGDIEFSSKDSNTLFTLHTGFIESANRIGQSFFKSMDSGRTWTNVSALGYLPDSGGQLEVDPTSDTIYAQLTNGKILKSTNGGNNWESASKGILQHVGSWTLALNKRNPSILYSAGPTGIYRTFDRGSAWQKLNLNCSDCVPNSISINPIDDGIVYVAGAGSDQTHISLDNGNSWQPMSLSRFPGLPGQVISSSPISSGLIFAGITTRGIFRSTNAGRTWSLSTRGIENLTIRQLELNANRAGEFLVIEDSFLESTNNRNLTLFSSNYGATWKYPTNLGLVDPQFAAIQTSDPNFQVLAGRNLAITTDGGKSWTIHGIQPIGGLVLGNTSKSIFINRSQIFKSGNLGGSWQNIGPSLSSLDESVDGFTVDPKNDDTVFAILNISDKDVFQGRIAKTVDGGRVWKNLKISKSAGAIFGISIHPKNSNLLYVSTGGGLFKSTNAGSSWNNVAPGFHGGKITLDPWNQNRVFVLIYDQIWFTKNGGSSWNLFTSEGIPIVNGDDILQLAVSPWSAQTLYAVTSEGIYDFKGN